MWTKIKLFYSCMLPSSRIIPSAIFDSTWVSTLTCQIKSHKMADVLRKAEIACRIHGHISPNLKMVLTSKFQYLVMHPLTARTARTRLGRDWYRDLIYVGVSEVHISKTLSIRSCRVLIWETRFCSFILTVLHTFSMILILDGMLKGII